MSDAIITSDDKLKNLIRDVLLEHERNKVNRFPPKLYTINKVAKMTHKSHATIKKKVMQGIIESTDDGLITEQALNDYLKVL